MSKRMFVAPLAVLALAASACGSDSKSATTTAAGAATTAAAAATTAAGGDCSAKIGFMGPFTGDAASIGQEQLNWGKLGLADFNKANGTSFTFVETDTKLDPAEATTGGQKLVSDAGVVAILGPAGSQEVEAVGPAMTGAGLVYVSPSATRTSLTIGGKLPTFVRVVPNDDAQGPTVAKFAKDVVKASKVLIIDDQTSYSTGLADSAAATLKTLGVTVNRE